MMNMNHHKLLIKKNCRYYWKISIYSYYNNCCIYISNYKILINKEIY